MMLENTILNRPVSYYSERKALTLAAKPFEAFLSQNSLAATAANSRYEASR